MNFRHRPCNRLKGPVLFLGPPRGFPHTGAVGVGSPLQAPPPPPPPALRGRPSAAAQRPGDRARDRPRGARLCTVGAAVSTRRCLAAPLPQSPRCRPRPPVPGSRRPGQRLRQQSVQGEEEHAPGCGGAPACAAGPHLALPAASAPGPGATSAGGAGARSARPSLARGFQGVRLDCCVGGVAGRAGGGPTRPAESL